MDEAKRLEKRNEVAKRLDGLVDEIAISVKVGVRKDIQEAVEPRKERQDIAEKENEAANPKIKKLEDDVKEMREEMALMKETKPDSWASKVAEGGGRNLPEGWMARSQRSHTTECPSNTKDSRRMDDKNLKVSKIIREAKKIVGMKPIDKAHVEHTMRRNEETDKEMDNDERWERAKDETVKFFLKYELKIKGEDTAQLKITRIFPLAKDEWNMLYVEFESIEIVNFLMSFTQYMRRGLKGDRPSIKNISPRSSLPGTRL